MRTVLGSEDSVIRRCISLAESMGIGFEWSPNPEKNPHAVGGTYEWNRDHGKDPSGWTSIVVDRPEAFPSEEAFALVVCYEIEKLLLYRRIGNPSTDEDFYWARSCDYAKGLHLWSRAIMLANRELGIEPSMETGSYINALVIGGSLSENQFRWNQRGL